jgi:hypothetical protein
VFKRILWASVCSIALMGSAFAYTNAQLLFEASGFLARSSAVCSDQQQNIHAVAVAFNVVTKPTMRQMAASYEATTTGWVVLGGQQFDAMSIKDGADRACAKAREFIIALEAAG